MVRSGPWGYPRLKSTTLDDSQLSDFAEITHPFHPLHGQKFAILKSRKLAQRDEISLKGSHRGTIVVPRDWTDRSDPNPYTCLGGPLPILSYERLCAIVDLIAAIRQDS